LSLFLLVFNSPIEIEYLCHLLLILPVRALSGIRRNSQVTFSRRIVGGDKKAVRAIRSARRKTGGGRTVTRGHGGPEISN